jgi:hypothetical protein
LVHFIGRESNNKGNSGGQALFLLGHTYKLSPFSLPATQCGTQRTCRVTHRVRQSRSPLGSLDSWKQGRRS